MRCPSYNKIAHIPVKEASVSTTNTLLKSGRVRTGALVINTFKY
jgi:hypothetical protein